MRSSVKQRVFLHVGEPKTGTTFLQHVLWRNRDVLAGAGVVLPGHHPQDHFRASQDLRGLTKSRTDPAAPWTGEWDVLAAEARRADGTAVISHELFSAAAPRQMERAARSFAGSDLHIVVTVRDMATLIPAEWQETIKHRNTRPWLDWLTDIIDRESGDPNRRRFWFWNVHDTLANLQDWVRFVPPEHIHVVTVPPHGTPRETLWCRFAGVLGIDPDVVDLSRARANASLGIAETEYLRRLNELVVDRVPSWFYMANVKEPIAHRALAASRPSERLVLPVARLPWASEEGHHLVAGLRAGGFDVVGELDELLPVAIEGTEVAEPTPEDVLTAALTGSATAVIEHYQRTYPAIRPQQRSTVPSTLPERIEAIAAGSPRLKRTVRRMSSRYPAIRKLRVLVWRRIERHRDARK